MVEHRAGDLLRDRSWRRYNSLWMLGTVFACHIGAAAGLIYIGRTAHNRWWTGAGVVYLLLGVPVVGVFFGSPMESRAEDLSFGVGFALWAVTAVHVVVVNPRWLEWRAADEERLWNRGTPRDRDEPAPAAETSAAPAELSKILPARSDYVDGAPPEPATLAPVDVNLATAEDLERLPGFPGPAARWAYAHRLSHGPFRSVDDFVTIARLPPHVLVGVRPLLRCSAPPPDAGTQRGRVLDV